MKRSAKQLFWNYAQANIFSQDLCIKSKPMSIRTRFCFGDKSFEGIFMYKIVDRYMYVYNKVLENHDLYHCLACFTICRSSVTPSPNPFGCWKRNVPATRISAPASTIFAAVEALTPPSTRIFMREERL